MKVQALARARCAASVFLLAILAAAAGEPEKPFLVSTNFDNPASTTHGIQEAIEALPSGGGTVYVPPGEFILERTIIMRPGTQLIGAGKNTILKKAPLKIFLLAEDVKKDSGLDYVIVRDAAGLRPGMAVHVGDKVAACDIESAQPWVIRKIEGARVYLDLTVYQWWTDDQKAFTAKFKPKADLKVERQAALVTAFWAIKPAVDCLIENLSVDGNKEAQKIDGREAYKDYPGAWEVMRNIKGVGRRNTIRRCWIHDAAGVNLSCSSGRALITDCEIWGALQGIHPGAGPLVKIVNNIIHDHQDSGIYFCMGNYGCMVVQNHIYNNGHGIYGLGCRIYTYASGYENKRYLARDGDHYHIISQNLIFNNRRSGIGSQQGVLGPTDYVITDNIIMNNNLDGEWPISKDDLPGGIALYNARNCVIANNRCYDDQDEFGCGELVADAPAGSRLLTIKFYDARPVSVNAFQDPPYMEPFRLVLSNGAQQEEVNVIKRDATPNGVEMRLDAPLQFSYPKGTDPRILKSQQWGLVVVGPASAGNVIMGNQCAENILGGMLYYNAGGSVLGNVGAAAAVDPSRSFLQNLFPAETNIAVANPGFEEDGGWKLGPGASLEADAPHTGKRALKVMLPDKTQYSASQSAEFELQPNRRYRLSGWVKVSAGYCDAKGQLKRPDLSLVTGAGATYALPALGVTNGLDAVRVKLVADQWLRYEGIFKTGSELMKGHIRCQLANGAGAAWFDDLEVEELKWCPMRSFGKETNAPAILKLPAGAPNAGVRGLPFVGQPEQRADVNLDIRRSAKELTLTFTRQMAAGEKAADNAFYALFCPNAQGPFHFQYKLDAQGAGRQENHGLFTGDWQAMAWGAGGGFTVNADGQLTARIAIPFVELGLVEPGPGNVWRAQFGHTLRGADKVQVASWNGNDSWHDVKTYGILIF